MKIEENVPLKDFTTFRTGGPARYFVVVKDGEELRESVRFAREKDLEIFTLGGGSNLLVSDEGFSGLVIKLDLHGVEYEELPQGFVRVISGASESWDTFVDETVERGFGGLENLSLIPGTVGAAPVQNIGAYGREVRETIEWVEALDKRTAEMKNFSNKECAFGYRESFFKTIEGKNYIITRVSFSLRRGAQIKADYPDVQAYFFERGITDPSLREVREAVVAIRSVKLPSITDVGTAGSFFKNPIILKERAQELSLEYADMPIFSAGEMAKIPAAWLIDKVCGLRGYRSGNVGTHERQAVTIVNYGSATTREILEFAEMIKERVKQKTGINLEREVQVVGSQR